MPSESSTSRAPSLRDVAEEAGVSYQTVSRVINDSPHLKPETRDRVRAAIDKLGYRPNASARALVTSKSRVIGVLIANRLTAFGIQTILYAIEDAARDAGYRVAIASATGDTESIESALDQLMQQAAEAVVVVAPQARIFAALGKNPLRVPYVMLDSQRRDQGHSVAVDQFEGGRLATRHLLDLGHRQILHLAGPRDSIEAETRMQGYVREIGDAEINVRAPVLGEWSAEFGYQAGLELVHRSDFSAVFCASDQIALGLLHAFRNAGVRVPADVSVIGFDDIPEAAHFSPPLTTVRQDFAEVGRRAVALLLGELGFAEQGETGLLRPQLVLRASTGAPTRAFS